MSEGWQRVTRANPCGICEKPDWCCKGERGWACMRVDSDIPLANGGHFHPFDKRGGDAIRIHQTRPVAHSGAAQSNPDAAPNFYRLLSEWSASTNGEVGKLAFDLGVSERTLKALGTAYAPCHRAFAFPMCDGNGRVTGIRLRWDSGEKKAVTGSKQGLFLPMVASEWLSTDSIMICEGPTDTAAALTLGIFAIGRPQCSGCEEMTAEVLRQLGCRNVIICFDNDHCKCPTCKVRPGTHVGPGPRGAEKLAGALRGIRVTRFVPPSKDLRSFAKLGGNLQLLQSMTGNAIRTRV